MKIWKVEHSNKTTEGAKVAVSISSSESRGFILKPGEFVLCKEQQTASLDSQTRRGFVVTEEFDNTTLRLQIGVVYNRAVLNNVASQPEPVIEPIIESVEPSNKIEEDDEFQDKFEKAKKDASDYINNNDKQ